MIQDRFCLSGRSEHDLALLSGVEGGEPAAVEKPEVSKEPEATVASAEGARGAAFRWAQQATRPLAAIMLVVVLFGRAVAPALRGIAVGYDAFTNRAAFVADALAIAFLLGLLSVAFLQSTALAVSRVPLYLRIPALLLSGLAVLVGLAAPSVPRPPFPLLLVASSTASALALLTGGSIVRLKTTRLIGSATLLAGLATAVRLVSVFVADSAVTKPKHEGPELARVLATGAFGLEGLLLAIGAIWIAARNRKLALPMVIIALALAGFAARSVALDTSNTGALAVILRIGARALLTRPVPLVPYYAEVFLVVLGPLLALCAVLLRAEVGTWVGSLAIVLLVRSAGEIPLYAASLAVASTAMLLAAHDPSTLWSALTRRENR